ncbi:MAG TPA: dockerin type I repeat-containing protein, partial [Thermoanaerobaculia bacterium]|nr:dockerin type I repeat-containing protein [Thermoanaerobaculia bacterium]
AANGNSAVNGCAAGLAEAPDLITFSVNGTIQLTSELLPVQSAAIRGPGASRLVLSGQGTTRVFDLGFSGSVLQGDYTLTGLTIANGNVDFGAGIQALGQHTVALSEVAMRGNLATSNGGALYTQESTAVQLTKSTFTNATGSSAGRLVSVINGSLEAENCSFYDSSSLGPLGIVAAGTGKAAFLRAKNLTLSGTDPSGIQAHAQSGALVSDARAEYSGTIVQHPLGFAIAAGTGVSFGYNISSDSTGNLGATGDQPNTDAIPPTLCGPVVDQRGFARPFGTNCDIGAVERRPGGDVNGDGSFNVSDIFYLINFLFAGGPVPVGESDMNGDGVVDVADVFYAINTLFAGGAAPI